MLNTKFVTGFSWIYWGWNRCCNNSDIFTSMTWGYPIDRVTCSSILLRGVLLFAWDLSFCCHLNSCILSPPSSFSTLLHVFTNVTQTVTSSCRFLKKRLLFVTFKYIQVMHDIRRFFPLHRIPTLSILTLNLLSYSIFLPSRVPPPLKTHSWKMHEPHMIAHTFLFICLLGQHIHAVTHRWTETIRSSFWCFKTWEATLIKYPSRENYGMSEEMIDEWFLFVLFCFLFHVNKSCTVCRLYC